MSVNLLIEAFADSRRLAQIIEAAVMRTEKWREASVTHTMDKLLYEAFVQFAMRTKLNSSFMCASIDTYISWLSVVRTSERVKEIIQALQTDDFRYYLYCGWVHNAQGYNRLKYQEGCKKNYWRIMWVPGDGNGQTFRGNAIRQILWA